MWSSSQMKPQQTPFEAQCITDPKRVISKQKFEEHDAHTPHVNCDGVPTVVHDFWRSVEWCAHKSLHHGLSFCFRCSEIAQFHRHLFSFTAVPVGRWCVGRHEAVGWLEVAMGNGRRLQRMEVHKPAADLLKYFICLPQKTTHAFVCKGLPNFTDCTRT